jgi:hypothetical protein
MDKISEQLAHEHRQRKRLQEKVEQNTAGKEDYGKRK